MIQTTNDSQHCIITMKLMEILERGGEREREREREMESKSLQPITMGYFKSSKGMNVVATTERESERYTVHQS